MSAIYNLSTIDAVEGSDQVLIYSPSSGVTAKMSISALVDYVLQNDQSAGAGMETQYASPSATGFSVQLNPTTDGDSLYLLLSPLAGYAAGTIVMPALAEAENGQEVLVTSTQAVAALTVTGNGASVTGAPTSIAANGFFRLRFNSIFNGWIRIG